MFPFKKFDENIDVDQVDTFIRQVFEEAVPKSLSGTKSLEDSDLSSFEKDATLNSRSHLIVVQHRDAEISPLFEGEVDEKEVLENTVCFFTRNGVRIFLPRMSVVPKVQ